MADHYSSLQTLLQHHQEGSDFIRIVRAGTSGIAIIAPHGGKIEPGTSEIARAIAGEDHSLYHFEGQLPSGNRKLHITSERFNDPPCLELIAACPIVVAIHGLGEIGEAILIGGRDLTGRDQVRMALHKAGYKTIETHPRGLQGLAETNICNRGATQQGIQLELAKGLRKHLTNDVETLDQFAAVVREALRRLMPGY